MSGSGGGKVPELVCGHSKGCVLLGYWCSQGTTGFVLRLMSYASDLDDLHKS